MKKKLIRGALVLLLLVVVGLGVLYFRLNSIIRSVAEKQATASLGVKAELGGANLGLFKGTLNLSDFKVASPQGYAADHILTLGGVDLGVSYGQLREQPIRVNSIVVAKPAVVLEFASGKFNFQALMDNMGGGSASPTSKEPKTDDGKDPVKLIIDELTVTDATVTVKAFAPLLSKDLVVSVPSITLKNIGNADGAKNGAAIKDVVGAVISALAAKVTTLPDLKNFGDLNKMLGSGAQAVMGNISKEMEKQVGAIQQQITGEIGKVLPGGGDIGKSIPGGGDLGKLLGGDKKDKEKK